MARRRQFSPRTRTIVRYVKTRARRYAPRKKKNNILLIGAAIVGAAFLFKDKLKTLLPNKA